MPDLDLPISKTAWCHSPSHSDFRSDTLTTPTLRQLHSLHNASLGDDVFRESTTTTAFESRLAHLFCKESSLFVLSGTMGNQLSLRALLEQPPHSVLCDYRSHLYSSEAGGLSMWSQATAQPIIPQNGKHLTLEDVQKHAVISNNVHYAPTKVISLENTLGGNVLPLLEVQRISAWAKEKDIKMHLDGARLWNAVSECEDKDERIDMLRKYAKEFDTVTVCFSKGLGAPIGGAIMGSSKVVAKARHFRKAMGGGVRQLGVLTAMAEEAMEEVFMEGRLREVNEKARRIAEFWREKCKRGLGCEVETNMVWLAIGQEEAEKLRCFAKEVGVNVSGGRIVVHWQITDDAVDRLCVALEKLAKEGGEHKVLENGEFQVGAYGG